jgi:multicomponent K+:H+ antiporter subunit A
MLPAIVLLPWLVVPLLGTMLRAPRMLPAWVAAAANAVALGILIALAPAVFDGEALTWTLHWIPSIGLDLSFRLDGLGFLFALLILAIGLLIVLYAAYYLSDEPRLNRFYALLMLFTGAMLGVVLSENILLLFVFWELTSLSSYLLIGFDHERGAARAAALQALLVTGWAAWRCWPAWCSSGRQAGVWSCPHFWVRPTGCARTRSMCRPCC